MRICSEGFFYFVLLSKITVNIERRHCLINLFTSVSFGSETTNKFIIYKCSFSEFFLFVFYHKNLTLFKNKYQYKYNHTLFVVRCL